jgi:hypothetical protein
MKSFNIFFEELLENNQAYVEDEYSCKKTWDYLEKEYSSIIDYLESFIEFCPHCGNPKDDCIC